MEKKTADRSLNDAFDGLLDQCREACGQPRVFQRLKRLAYSTMLCLGRHTITGMLTTSGEQFTDWSAAYRLFERSRFDPHVLFHVARRQALACIPPQSPVVAVIDDTLVRKRGIRVHGASWRRDPLGPPFATNYVWAQRFLQLSLAIPETAATASRACAIPVDLQHCPTARKPKPSAPKDAWDAYHLQARAARLSAQGAARVQALRQNLDADGERRSLIIAADGGYTNRTMLSALPDRTTLIGRIRKDARLFAPPAVLQCTTSPGRRRSYGSALPTPEEMRKDPAIPWQSVSVSLAGHTLTLRAKVVGPVRWRQAAGPRDMQLIIIEPRAYQRSANSRTLYREPGYLIVTDPTLDLATILQSYIWRWEIELNFRDEKTLLGTGQAQVRTEPAVRLAPALSVAAYALLLLAHRMSASDGNVLPRPRWQQSRPHRKERTTTAAIIRQLRGELWGKALGVENFSGFDTHNSTTTTTEKLKNTVASAVLYAIN